MSSFIPNRVWTKAGLKDAFASIICFNVSNFQGLDFIVDGGPRIADPSTVVDMTGTNPTIIRQGKGPKLDWMVAEDEEEDAQSKFAFKAV